MEYYFTDRRKHPRMVRGSTLPGATLREPRVRFHNPSVSPNKCYRRRSTARTTATIQATRLRDMAAMAMVSGVANT